MNDAALEARLREIHADGEFHERGAEERVGKWFGEAEVVLRNAFPADHVFVKRLCEHRERYFAAERRGAGVDRRYTEWVSSRGLVLSAAESVSRGEHRSFIEGIKAQTVGEVLAQATALLGQGYLVAAAVLAGGALETHLLHLCLRNNLPWQGHGSISKYNGAISQARNLGTVTVYNAADTQQVGAWAAIRNEAAHDPANLARARDEVERMVDGIRAFLARVP